MKTTIAALLFVPLSLFAQSASPLETTYATTMAAQNLALRTGSLVAGQATPKVLIAGHHLFLGVGFNGGSAAVPLAALNAYTDSLAMWTTWMDVNADASLFVGSGPTGGDPNNTLPTLDTAYIHAAAKPMQVKINWVLGTGGAGPAAFAIVACKNSLIGGAGCDTATSPCSIPKPCIKNFADFQAYALGSSGPMKAMATRLGAPGILGGQMAGFNVAHELQNLSDSALNPNWDTVTTGQGSASDWAAFIAAAVTLIRGISSGSCTACGTVDISATVVYGGNTDASVFFPAFCFAGAPITSCGIDVYPSPTNNLISYMGNINTLIATVCKAAGKPCFFQESVPSPGWVPSWAPQSDSDAYKGAQNRDHDLLAEQIDFMKSELLAASAMGFERVTLFNTAPTIWYNPQPSCPNFPVLPNACTAADSTCGTDGTHCGADIVTLSPGISLLSNYLQANGGSITKLGQFLAKLNASWGSFAQ